MNEEEIKAWMAECTRLVIDHLRRQGFPIDDYRVDLVLTERARDPDERLTATELIARLAVSGLPPEYPKPRFVVPDNMVDAFREAFRGAAEIIPISETMLPPDSAEPPR